MTLCALNVENLQKSVVTLGFFVTIVVRALRLNSRLPIGKNGQSARKCVWLNINANTKSIILSPSRRNVVPTSKDDSKKLKHTKGIGRNPTSNNTERVSVGIRLKERAQLVRILTQNGNTLRASKKIDASIVKEKERFLQEGILFPFQGMAPTT